MNDPFYSQVDSYAKAQIRPIHIQNPNHPSPRPIWSNPSNLIFCVSIFNSITKPPYLPQCPTYY